MIQVGLISDTHGYIGHDAMKHLDKCDEVWHAGDIGDLDTVSVLQQYPVLRMVWGNIDGAEIRKLCPEHQLFVTEGLKVLMMHIGGYPGRYTKRAYALIRKEQPDLFISGHSHILKVMKDKNLGILHMNPGAVGYKGFHQFRTMITFAIEGGKVTHLKAIDFGPRSRRP